ncbi:hypothetical protein JZ751_028582 [Albula glossodonta]|uniref:GYF domain-containing protein n=1 Tax=Albula glossodonta TaxID=121402 RepID=A0A8T2NIS1_9TELE|nr:hypothetical protein JZ751_028582 [Albula glossodonta]
MCHVTRTQPSCCGNEERQKARTETQHCQYSREEIQERMAETQTLNFGPEWLRALSGGGSVTSPPLSPALPKYKLADYRYGREEMLALYVKDNKIPLDLQDKEFLPILQEEPLPPLALVPFTEEEQRSFSMSVNSAAVLRLTGRGGGTVAGAPRGRSSSRGRGRGRGEGGFYQRSFDDVEGGFGRGAREMHRSQSWEERGDRRFEKPGRKEPVRSNYEEGGTGVARKHEFTRSESENWRIAREEQNGEDDEGGWRLAGSRRDSDRWRPHSPDGLRSAGWREHPDQRRRFPFDSREEERSYRRARAGSGSQDDERDSLPEWCLDDAEEEMGTFDSSGAFLSLKVRGSELSNLPSRKKAPKEPIPEEVELDFRPSEECEEHSDKADSEPDETKEPDGAGREEEEKDSGKSEDKVSPVPSPPSPRKVEPQAPPSQPESVEMPPERVDRPPAPEVPPSEPIKAPHPTVAPSSLVEGAPLHHSPAISALPPVPQQRPPEIPMATPAPLPVQADIGPGSGPAAMLPVDMDDDEGLKHFEQEAEKMVAYLQDNAVDEERVVAKAKPTALPVTHEAALKWFYKDPQGEIQGPFTNQEMVEWFQAGYFTMTLLVKRGCDELFQPLGEIIKMWGRVPFTPGPSPQPLLGDVDHERLKRQQEITALNLMSEPAVTRSMSMPDSGSIWEMQSPSTQPAASTSIQHGGHSAWESGSVWDLPIDSMVIPPTTIEQMQQLEKAKAVKLEQERREAELRAKREEEERKRQEEVLRRQQEEEQKRREEEELARRNQEEALRREQEAALRRQKEEEEERRQREELLRKQLPSSSKWGQQSAIVSAPSTQNTLSLAEIQKLEEERERQAREEEEALQMKQRQQQQKKEQTPAAAPQNRAQNRTSNVGNSVWGSVNNSANQWTSADLGGSIWGGTDAKDSNIGFWDEAVKEATPPPTRNSKNNKSHAHLSNSLTGRSNKKVEEEERKLLKLFQGVNNSQDGFTQWCEQTLHTLNTANNLDVPTFASFLKEVESPYEIHDYDSVWGVNQTGLKSIFQSNHNSLQQSNFETVQSGKKKKKQKMVRADPSLLGFSVNAASERLNMGEIETVEDF